MPPVTTHPLKGDRDLPISSSGLLPINDLKRLYASSRQDLLSAVTATLESGWWLNGKEADRFCVEFAAYLGVEHCVGVANGTDALEIAMRAMLSARGIGKREVVTVANAGGYSSVACRLLGLVPVYADIEEASQLASLPSILAAIGPQTAFVVVTHLYGNMVDVALLREEMDAVGHEHVPIIEDCAQAHGASLKGRKAGSLGDIATFSFYPTKNLGAFGDGGALVTSDGALLETCSALRQYGWAGKYEIALAGGRNSRLDEVQAAILRVLLPGLDAANARRRTILRRYVEAASPAIRIVSAGDGGVAHLAVILCDDRDDLRRLLAENGIQSDIHYPVLDCDQPAWRHLPQRTAPGELAIARRCIGRLLTLPCFPTMTEHEIERVCGILSRWTS